MDHNRRERDEGQLIDPGDAEYVESLAPGPERDVVVASLMRHRRPEALGVGDAVPDVTLRRAADLAPVRVPDLCAGRPLLLVFGSFT